MAITITEVQRLITSTNATSYALSAYTPTINTLQVVFVYLPGSISAPWSMTDGGSTEGWRRRSTTLFNSLDANSDALMVWTAWQYASPVSMTPSFTCTGDAATGCLLVWYEIAGVNTEDGPIDIDLANRVPGGNAVGADAVPTAG